MNKNQDGLYNLLEKDEHAKMYYMSLPDYVQGALQQRIQNISNVNELKSEVEMIRDHLLSET